MEIIKKLIQIQSELKAPKGQFNRFGGYKYRSCEDILEAVKPLLAKAEICMVINDQIEKIDTRFYLKAIVKVFDSTGTIETQSYAREEESKKGMDGSQVTGAASSYARKYALNAMFLIDDTRDADVTNTHGKDDIPESAITRRTMLELEKKPENPSYETKNPSRTTEFDFQEEKPEASESVQQSINAIDNELYRHAVENINKSKNLEALKGFWYIITEDIKSGTIDKKYTESLTKIKETKKQELEKKNV